MEQDNKELIACARGAAIFFVVYAHAYFGGHGMAGVNGEFDVISILRHALKDGLAHASVPALSVISGWLAAEISHRHTHLGLLVRKARTLVLPMVFWSVVTLIVYAIVGLVPYDPEFLRSQMPSSPLAWVNAFFGVSDAPFNGPLYFLRDLFVIFVIYVTFKKIIVARPVVTFLFGVALYLLEGVVVGHLEVQSVPVLFRPEVLGLFLIGVSVSKSDLRIRRVLSAPALTAICFGCLIVVVVAALLMLSDLGSEPTYQGISLKIQRAAGVGLLLSAAELIRTRRVGKLMIQLEPYAFVVFCSHAPILFVVAQLVGKVTGWSGESLILDVFFFGAPVLVYALAAGVVLSLRRVWPGAAEFVTGGRKPMEARR
ncbi:MAG: acyltransferase [Spiribacter salinus]|uniref:Acyltransferase n=1 Tax=Spiribacter salinus TaxID=1335746 RepID=A0A540VMR5_9GAMM|nr:MAG: acyltransferase [Spiribacter salinus]